MLDAVANEPHFLAHIAPIWRALPDKGTFYIDGSLTADAAKRQITAEVIDANAVRRSMRAPDARIADGPTALVASYGDIKVARRMGYRRFAFIEHGIGQSYEEKQRKGHGSYAGGTDREDCGLFLVPNERSAERWRLSYPQAQVVIIGSPRLADLPRKNPTNPPVVALSFHWPAMVHPFAGTAFGDFWNALGPLTERYQVIGHSHPKGDWPARMAERYRRIGLEFVADFDEVCRRADLYIADNTSSLYEFAATGRPVVVLNARHWTRNIELGLRFWEAATVGINVDPVIRRGSVDVPATGSRLVDAVVCAIENRPEDVVAREAALGIVYAEQPEEGLRRAVQALTTFAAVEAVAA